MRPEVAVKRMSELAPKISQLDNADKELFLFLGQMLITRNELSKEKRSMVKSKKT